MHSRVLPAPRAFLCGAVVGEGRPGAPSGSGPREGGSRPLRAAKQTLPRFPQLHQRHALEPSGQRVRRLRSQKAGRRAAPCPLACLARLNISSGGQQSDLHPGPLDRWRDSHPVSLQWSLCPLLLCLARGHGLPGGLWAHWPSCSCAAAASVRPASPLLPPGPWASPRQSHPTFFLGAAKGGFLSDSGPFFPILGVGSPTRPPPQVLPAGGGQGRGTGVVLGKEADWGHLQDTGHLGPARTCPPEPLGAGPGGQAEGGQNGSPSMECTCQDFKGGKTKKGSAHSNQPSYCLLAAKAPPAPLLPWQLMEPCLSAPKALPSSLGGVKAPPPVGAILLPGSQLDPVPPTTVASCPLHGCCPAQGTPQGPAQVLCTQPFQPPGPASWRGFSTISGAQLCLFKVKSLVPGMGGAARQTQLDSSRDTCNSPTLGRGVTFPPIS